MPTEAYQSSLDAINSSALQQNKDFEVWIVKVIAAIRARGFAVKYRLDSGGDGVFTTHTTAQVDVTKENVTARVAYSGYHLRLSAESAAGMAERNWIVQKNSAALGFAPLVEGPAITPITTTTSFNYNREAGFGELGPTPAVSLPPTNQPGRTNTTVPSSGNPGNQTSGTSPTNPENGSQPAPSIPDPLAVIDTGGPAGIGAPVTTGTDWAMVIGIVALVLIGWLIFVKS